MKITKGKSVRVNGNHGRREKVVNLLDRQADKEVNY